MNGTSDSLIGTATQEMANYDQGICFSLIFHIPFACIYDSTDGAFERLSSLLGLVGLEDRLITEDVADEQIKELVTRVIDWKRVDSALGRHVEESRAWLRAALDAPAKEQTNADYIHDAQIDERLRLAADLRNARCDAARYKDEVDAVRSSTSFRAGLALTWLPRKIKDYDVRRRQS